MAPIPPTGRESWAPSLLETTKSGPPADDIWWSTHSIDTSDAAEVYGPASATSNMSRACRDRTFLCSQAARLIRSHSAALWACHGACVGIDRHIRRTLLNPKPRFIVAQGFSVHGMVPA